MSLDTNPGTKRKTVTPAEARALENRIQQVRDALFRATYKLESLEAANRGKRPTNIREVFNAKRDVALLKHKLKELNDELASIRIVTNPSSEATEGH